MGFVRLRVRAERRRPGRWSGAVLLLALAGSASLFAAQAARRTDTAFDRALAVAQASDAVVNADTTGYDAKQTAERRDHGTKILDAVDRSEIVVAHGRFGGVTLERIVDGKVDTRLTATSAFGLVAYDDRIGRTISKPRVIDGRLARVDRADEATITPEAAALLHWRVGTEITDLREYDWSDLNEDGTTPPDGGHPLRLRVVGITVYPEWLIEARSERQPRVYLTPAFARRFPNSVFYLTEAVRLRNGSADIPALRQVVAAANRIDPAIDMPIALTAQQLAKVNRANDPLVNGLWILAFAFGLVGVLLAGQSLGRSLSARADDHAQFRALGATRRQRYAIELATLALVALAAAVLAAVVGVLFSPFTPVGTARPAEPDPGFSVNLVLTLSAIAAIFAGTMLAAVPSLRRVARTTALPGTAGVADPRGHVSHAADVVARSGLRTPAVIGTRFALQPGHGTNATPVRSVLVSLTLVIATVTAVLSFGVNLQRWTSTPHLYGWNWDAAVGTNFGTIPPEFERLLEHFPRVEQVSAMTLGRLTIAEKNIPAVGIDPLRGDIAPRVDRGRLPQTEDEIVLGAKTMRAVHAHVGDTVTATISGKDARLQVVGSTTFPAFGNERGAETGLGTGALGTTARFPTVDPTNPDGRYNYFLLRFAPGTTVSGERALRKTLIENGCDASCLLTDSRPAEIDGYRNVRRLPLALGIVLALLLVATLTHVLVSTMRRRSRDLSILRALGCTRRNLSSTLRWQSVILTSVAIVVGIPLGLIANNVAWSAFTSQLGIAPGTVTPIAILAAGAAGVLLLALALATMVGLRASTVTRAVQLES
jgi:ABC-type lipoprotein release transport system permease subunit